MSRARHKKHRESGGRTNEWVSGNPDVKKEAEAKGEGGSGDTMDRKRGGKVKKHVGHMHGGKAKHRADRPARKRGGKVGPIEAHMGSGYGHVPTGASKHNRPGRKRGGGVGADKSPLSSAHKGKMDDGAGSSSPADTYGGLPSD